MGHAHRDIIPRALVALLHPITHVGPFLMAVGHAHRDIIPRVKAASPINLFQLFCKDLWCRNLLII